MNKYSISYNDIVSINKIKDVYDGIYKNMKEHGLIYNVDPVSRTLNKKALKND